MIWTEITTAILEALLERFVLVEAYRCVCRKAYVWVGNLLIFTILER